jgi:hypothetical protein
MGFGDAISVLFLPIAICALLLLLVLAPFLVPGPWGVV